MNYKTLIHKLFNINNLGGIKLGLSNMQRMLEALSHPEKAFRSIHVAGTNGKGSVTTKIAKGLECKYSKVGLFTSPHISSFRERIQINGNLISEEDTTRLLSKIFSVQEKLGINATFFELTTILCFLYFAENKVEYAAIETGLGGRLDATNVLNPELSIITSIAFDHTEFLGNTLEKIATEKAGIIKENVPILIGPRVPYDAIVPVAAQKAAKLIQVKGSFNSFNEENNAIAKEAMQMLKLPHSVIATGLEAIPPCRFELIQKSPPILCDVAHNPDGLNALFNNIKNQFPNHSLHMVLGMSQSKDLESCMQILAKQNLAHLYLVKAASNRAAFPENLLKIALKSQISDEIITLHANVAEGIRKAKECQKESLLLITGTFFMMSEVRKELGFAEVCDSLDLA